MPTMMRSQSPNGSTYSLPVSEKDQVYGRYSEPQVAEEDIFSHVRTLSNTQSYKLPQTLAQSRVPISDEEKVDFEKEELTTDAKPSGAADVPPPAAITGGPAAPAGPPKGGPFALPESHPMHPSQFSGDRGSLPGILAVFGGFCAVFCSFGWINCIGVFQEYYQTHQLKNLSPSTISWIVSLETFFMFAGGPFVGKFYDSYGPRYLLLVGTILHVFGLMMTSLSTEYYQFILAQGICSPIGASMLFFPAMNCCLSWFFKWRATSFGIIASGGSLGGVIFPIVVANLIPKIGFGWTMRTCAFMILGLLIISNLTVKSRLKPNPQPLVLKEFVLPLKETPYVLLIIGSFLFFLGIFNPISFIEVQAAAGGMSPGLVPYLIPILNAVSIFGRTTPGWLADKFGRFNVMIIFCVFTTIVDLALWIPAKTTSSLIAFAALYGFGSGAFVSLYAPLIAQLTKPEQMGKLGTRNGTAFAIVSVSALIGQPIAGALLNVDHGNFLGVQIFTGGVAALGCAFYVITRINVYGWKLVIKA